MQTEQGSTINLDELKYQPVEECVLYRNLDALIENTHSLEQLLDTFFFETQSWIASDGMSFCNEARHVNYDVGLAARNKCHYRLYRGSNYLGEITFSRQNRFSLEELEIVEELLMVLSDPLQQAVIHETRIA